MRNPFGTIAISLALMLSTARTALSQTSLSKAPEHPSGQQVLENVEHWFADHRGAGIALGVTVVLAVGMIIYNRFIATR